MNALKHWKRKPLTTEELETLRDAYNRAQRRVNPRSSTVEQREAKIKKSAVIEVSSTQPAPKVEKIDYIGRSYVGSDDRDLMFGNPKHYETVISLIDRYNAGEIA